MEMNTSERRVNKDIVEILRPTLAEPAFKGTIKEGCECKYAIINLKDLEKYIGMGAQQDLAVILDHVQGNIERGREQDGKKPFNNYVVINIDEPYINDIVAIMEANGHWDGQPAAEDNTLNRYKKALEKILEEELPNCDGYETTITKIAREALGISEAELWEFDPEERKRCNELIDKYGYNRGVLIYNGMSVDDVLAYSDEDAEAAVEAMSDSL